MEKTPWTDAEEAHVRKRSAEGATDRVIAKELGRRRSQVTNFRQRHDIPGGRLVRDGQVPSITRVVSETPERVVFAPDDTEDEPIEDLLERAIRATNREVAKAKARRFAAARLMTRKPIGIAIASDQHLTMKGATDVERAFEDAETIQQEPGLFCILGGDGVDNHIKHRSALVNKGSSPMEEWRLYDHYIAKLGLKVLAVISGNHDDWTKDFAGVDQVANLAARNRVHYAPDEVVMSVNLTADANDPGIEYTIKVRHQYRFNSTLNVGHTVKRMYDMGGDAFDVGVVCHNHEAHSEPFERHGRTRWAVRPGSYQITTSHGRRYGYGITYPTCPVAVFFPDERRVMAFHDLREGITYLRAERARYDQEADALAA